MCATERAIGMEEGKGREGCYLTACFSNPQRDPHHIFESNLFTNSFCLSLCDCISNCLNYPNAIAESDNSSRWLLRRKVE